MTTATVKRVDIRAANAEEMEAFRAILDTVFAENDPSAERPETVQPAWTLCAFEDGELATTFAAYPFRWKLNGASVDVAGVTAVGTLPNKRRRGYLRRTMVESFGRQRDAGQGIAILWASFAAIYQRFGYAVTSMSEHYSIDPRDVRFANGPQPTGTVRLTTKEEQPLLRSIYRQYIEPRNGELHRLDIMWQLGTFSQNDKQEGPAYVAVYEENGEALGYVVYTNRAYDFGDPVERPHRLTVRELIWLTPAAYVALWRHVAAHDLTYRIEYHNAPEDDPIFHLLEEPRRLRRRTSDGILTRVVDVRGALAERPYGARASLTFEVIDSDCDWNNGVWELETDGAQSEVRRGQGTPQLRIPVHALAAMLTGFISPTRLAEQGRLEVLEHALLEEWDRVFATRHRPHCFNGF